MEIKKVFTSTGINGIKELTFKNLTGDKSGSGINLIYFTNCTNINYQKNSNTGVSFLSHAKIKTYFNSFIIPPSFVFYNHRVSTLKYIKYFKTNAPKNGINGRITKSIPLMKTETLQKSSFYDLTPLGESFKTVSNISEIKAIQELINLINNISTEYNKAYFKKEVYFLIESDYDNKEIFEMLLKYFHIKNNLFENPSNIFKGILVKVNNTYFPLTEEKIGLNGRSLGINLQGYNQIQKAILNEYSKKLKETGVIVPEVLDNDSTSSTSSTSIVKELSTDDKVMKNFSKIKSINTPIKDKKTELEINKILNQTNEILTKTDTNSNSNAIDTKSKNLKNLENNPKFEKFKKEIKLLKELNFKFNGSIKIDKNNLPKNIYYDPIKVTGLETVTGYNKQQTEFDEVLDEAMFDLFKSFENDPEVGLKIKDIKISFEDNIKNRFKIYKIKIQNTKFGYEKPYDIKLKVPYPSHGKYIKLDSNKYIMINQLFPYPILKIQPNTVRIYTHYSTAAVELKGSTVNLGSNDLNRIKDNFLVNLTESKKKVKTQDLDDIQVQNIKDKYNLPFNLNDKLFTNIEIK